MQVLELHELASAIQNQVQFFPNCTQKRLISCLLHTDTHSHLQKVPPLFSDYFYAFHNIKSVGKSTWHHTNEHASTNTHPRVPIHAERIHAARNHENAELHSLDLFNSFEFASSQARLASTVDCCCS